jgi:hypothetical protein
MRHGSLLLLACLATLIGCGTTKQEVKDPARTDVIDRDSVHSVAPARVIAGPTDSVKRHVEE